MSELVQRRLQTIAQRVVELDEQLALLALDAHAADDSATQQLAEQLTAATNRVARLLPDHIAMSA